MVAAERFRRSVEEHGMEQVNALRAILVAGAVVAALICLAAGIWSAGVLLLVGVGAHALLWRHLRQTPPESSGPSS